MIHCAKKVSWNKDIWIINIRNFCLQLFLRFECTRILLDLIVMFIILPSN
jgi:hypothetical protein